MNKIAISDSYPMPLQSDITAAVSGCSYISVIDAQGYFHQWPVKRSDRNKLTVVSHRGQEEFSVAVMGFKNSPPYVQRQTDHILRPHRAYARAYMDDIVVFSKTLTDHISHLRALFSLFNGLRICLSPAKSFLGYPSVSLLGQRVDGFGLTTSTKKLEAISSFQFPRSLRELESYVGLTGWLRNYIPYYAQIVDPLQKRKTTLGRQAMGSGKSRRAKTSSIALDEPTDQELLAFKHLQDQFRKPSILVHFDPEKPLYVDLDASKVYGFGAIILIRFRTRSVPFFFLAAN